MDAVIITSKSNVPTTMIDLTHFLDLATQLPHPSDIGLIKPSAGFNILAAIAGLIIFFQVAQIVYYGLPENEPKAGFGLDSDSNTYSYLLKQFVGVQIVVIIIASSVVLAGPDKIFFPFKYFS